MFEFWWRIKNLNFLVLVFEIHIDNQSSKPLERTPEISLTPLSSLEYTWYSQHCQKSRHTDLHQSCSFWQRHKWNQQRKTTFTLQLCDVKQSIVIGSCTLGIKPPLQLPTLNVIGALCDILFYVSMEIYHRKFTSRIVNHSHKIHFPMVRGQFTVIYHSKTAPCNHTY